MRFVLFFQTGNMFLIKQKYNFFKKIIFIIKHNRKTRFFLKKKIEKNKRIIF